MVGSVAAKVMWVERAKVFTVALALMLVAAWVVTAEPAEAAFPGANGKIAFSSNLVTATNPTGDSEIFTMEPDGTNVTQLTDNTVSDGFLAYSVDGTKIEFVSFRDGKSEIYKMEADGSNQTRLTNNSASDFRPAWSPDGTKIAFNSDRDGDNEIFVMNSDGSRQKNPTKNSVFDSQPDWQPT